MLHHKKILFVLKNSATLNRFLRLSDFHSVPDIQISAIEIIEMIKMMKNYENGSDKWII
jgi:hypothetical protein